jgi:hypothetical protein
MDRIRIIDHMVSLLPTTHPTSQIQQLNHKQLDALLDVSCE